MKKTPSRATTRHVRDRDADTMRPEYDFANGRRGVTATRYAQGSNVVVLDPDVSQVFPTSESVNEALRTLAGIAARTVKKRKRRSA
jgi:hypothetical protein